MPAEPAPSKQEVPATELCAYCDEYHEHHVACPHQGDYRRTTNLEEEEIDRASFARHDRRIFG